MESKISESICDASFQRRKTETTIEDAKQAIGELLIEIRSIKQKAGESETMADEICRDIKRLDCAKRNLTTTITALKRLFKQLY